MTSQSSQVGKWFNASKIRKSCVSSLKRQWSLRLGMEKEKKDTKNQPLPANEKMKREEAERILESARQDKIKRRKMQSKRPDRNEIFW